jgi:hypothetical protein
LIAECGRFSYTLYQWGEGRFQEKIVTFANKKIKIILNKE